MVSSRRLAREWALKILYQIDVGKSSLSEAQDTATERLRREFVQRGSRSASGSLAEEFCLDLVTGKLRSTLPTLRMPFERALTDGIGRLFFLPPLWQDIRFDRAYRMRPPVLEFTYSPDASESAEAMLALAGLQPEERAQYETVMTQIRKELPQQIQNAFAQEMASARPLTASQDEIKSWYLEQQATFNATIAERWRKVGTIVQKQTGDWLRTAAFTVKLVQGTYREIDRIDSELGALASGWRLERQVAVDRNILRLAGFEMLHLPGIPTGASINEAVELAKKYSTAESGRFVNGVLGALAVQIGEKAPPSDAADAVETDEQELDIPDIADIEESDTA